MKVIWFDKDNNIVDQKIVKPFSWGVKPDRPFIRIEEYPIKNISQ